MLAVVRDTGSSSFTIVISPVATMFDPALPPFVSDFVDLSSVILSKLRKRRRKRPVPLPKTPPAPQNAPAELHSDAIKSYTSRAPMSNTSSVGHQHEIPHDGYLKQRLFDFLCVLKAVEFRASIGRMMFCFPFEELSATREAMVEVRM